VRGLALRHERDGIVAAAALAHGLVAGGLLWLSALLEPPLPSRSAIVLLLALGLYWGCNTFSHIHLHAPLWRSATLNRLFSLALTLSLAVPQRLWQRQHLRHHSLPDPRGDRLRAWGWAEIAVLVAAIGAAAATVPALLLGTWLPAVTLGLLFCALAGHGEHAAAAAGVDHRGRLYNRLCFNDGHHCAHHRAPALHWTQLPGASLEVDVRSRWPPLVRWLDLPGRALNPIVATLLDGLERLALRAGSLRALLLATHAPALRALLEELAPPPGAVVVIVGGGLFPRTALLLGDLLPDARLILLDVSAANLTRAAAWLSPSLRARTELRCAHFDPARPVACDLLVIPLAFRGDRRALYLCPPAPAVLVHDWWWRRLPASTSVSSHTRSSHMISRLLLKCLFLMKASSPAAPITANLVAGVAAGLPTPSARHPTCPSLTRSRIAPRSCSPRLCSKDFAGAIRTRS
jgi:hypothetical protein